MSQIYTAAAKKPGLPPKAQRPICRTFSWRGGEKKKRRKKKEKTLATHQAEMSWRRRAVVLDKPVGSLRNRNERQGKADKDDELFLEAEIDDRRVVSQKAQDERFRI